MNHPLPGGFSPAPADLVTLDDRVAVLLRHRDAANSATMRVVNRLSGLVESRVIKTLGSRQALVEDVVEAALRSAYGIAAKGGRLGRMGDRGSVALAALSGAVGGFFGVAAALAELPVAITLILRSIQEVAAHHGFDQDDPETRAEVLRVFASGGPGSADDGVDTGLIGTRMALNGATVDVLIRRFLPQISVRMTQKLGAQAVPVLGAVTGAGVNMLFADYYRDVAHYHFGRLRLIAGHGEAAVAAAEARRLPPAAGAAR